MWLVHQAAEYQSAVQAQVQSTHADAVRRKVHPHKHLQVQLSPSSQVPLLQLQNLLFEDRPKAFDMESVLLRQDQSP